ncbi:FAD-dependent oxidoreductase [Sphingorhabdus buctiana]|uniref:FAD-dependent oxidoreductase n=1 Tax=Sphingorhabdus buctiana TaxID=1508805 RepID=A0ABW4M9B5_9SPHN
MKLTRRETLAAAGAIGIAAQAKAATSTQGVVDVAVIGAGVFGAWSAWHLKKAGLSVALIDQYSPGHARSSSGGESRVIRVSYGGDPLYSSMAVDSLAQWDALSQRQSQPILHKVGVLWFSADNDASAKQSLEWLRASGLGRWEGDAAALRARFQQMRFADNESGFIETGTGALIAGRGVQAVVADARLEAVRGKAESPKRLQNGFYEVAGITARSLVYACGPWLPKIFPEVLGGRIFVTRQEVFHFGAAPGDKRFAAPALPVWADSNAQDFAYGFPDLEGQGFKMAFDTHGEEVDPDTQNRQVSAAGVARARAYLKTRFPDLAEAPLIHARVCQYENSSNGDFLIDRLPGHDNVWLVGGGSGHGFKHGPAVGKRVAAHVINAATPVEPRFSLATKATKQNRTVY